MDDSGLKLQSLITEDGRLEVFLIEEAIPEPGADEVLVKVQAAPIHPSDISQLFGPADFSTARLEGTTARPVLTATIPEALMPIVAPRIGQPLPAGNEGAGPVIRAGRNCAHLEGKTVAMLGGEMYAQYRVMPASKCLPVPDGINAAACAASKVNPLTALCLVETMRMEGHTALVNTAAASSLGQMLVKICLKDGIGLVNIVRSDAQVKLLQDIGATHVVNSTSDSFMTDLVAALSATGATIAFDATGGGSLGGQILTAMEQVAVSKMTTFSRYGSDTFKQLYIYGNMDTSPTTFNRTFGVAWSIKAWLLSPFLQQLGMEKLVQLQQRIGAELTTTFATEYAGSVSLAGMLDPAAIATYAARHTGSKYLVTPWT